jgi:glutamyl-tRNA synthetase
LNKDGSKMSKRDQGASVASYMEGGYAPEAVRNYLCLLGWSPKDDREKMEISEVMERFDLANINRKSAQFDLDKCNWLNAQYLAHMPVERYAELARPFLEKAGIATPSGPELHAVLALVQEKVKFLTDVPEWVRYFFTDEYEYDAEAADKTLRKPGAMDRLEQLATAYGAVETWEATALETRLKEAATSIPCKPAEFIHPARVAVSGRSVGPSLYHMLEVLGKERVLARFARTVERFR